MTDQSASAAITTYMNLLAMPNKPPMPPPPPPPWLFMYIFRAIWAAEVTALCFDAPGA